MKKYLAGFITGILITLSIAVFADTATIQNAFFTSDIKLKVNGKEVPATFVNVSDTNYAKVRDIVSAVGGTTNWDGTTKTVEVTTTNSQPVTQSTESTSQPTGGKNQMEIQTYKIKSNVLKCDGNINSQYLISGNEGYMQVSFFSGYIKITNDSITFDIPSKPSIVIDRNSIGNDDKTIKYNGLTFVKLSALGLKATIDGDTLTIE